jgi:hypothetical protein
MYPFAIVSSDMANCYAHENAMIQICFCSYIHISKSSRIQAISMTLHNPLESLGYVIDTQVDTQVDNRVKTKPWF